MSMLTRNITIESVLVVVMCMCLLYPVYSSSPLNGRYTESIEDYKLTVPHKLTRSGEFASFDLPQHFEHDITKKRRRRSDDDADVAHYGVTLNGQDYHIELWPNHEFISPDLVVEHRDPKLRAGSERLRRLDKRVCHYTGHVRGLRNSRAALSTCDGLAGYITVDNERYFIEPVQDHQSNSEGHHLHVVHQGTRGVEATTNRCGTTSDWKEAWKKRFRDEFMREDHESIDKRGTVSERRYLETLVVADKKFITHHKSRDMELYIMTVMNMVADFYHDSSSGNQMDVVVVRIMYLEKEEEEIDLIINTNADKMLESFCKWQESINPKDIENPNHHDIAVLFTRYDICADDKGADCGLKGLAYVAAACTTNENCAITEDGGLNLGVVVAHEMGHLMGCSHDKEGESSCPAQDKDESYFVMAPYVHVFTTKWSTCSRGFITALFENSLGDCLDNEPKPSLYSFKNALPGTIYDAEAQCDIQYPGSKVCKMDEEKFCEMLICQVSPESCMSDEEPPQEGTKCGKDKWCFHKKCTEVGQRPEAVNGGWGSYGSWSSCSRTCGGGVSISERDCNNPVPQYGGRYCLGERKKFKICNKDPCPPDQPSFREVQCTEQNKKPFNNVFYTWTPKFKNDEPCVLYCINENHSYAKLEPRVKDGTPCKTGTKNRCISGVCRKIGCDFQLDSDAVEDVCGICNGDGTQCKIIEEVYKDTGAHDYKKVATIPQGSRNIHFEELAPSENTLAVSDKTEKVFYLNGNHVEGRDGDVKFGKVEGVYSHPEPGKEELVISGPIKEDLILFVVFYGPENVGYRYKYAEPSADLSYAPHYHWELLDWNDCSARCGGGTQESKYDCVEDKAGLVSSTFCVGEEKPETITKKCNEDPCKSKWKVGKWSECRACKNRSGVRSREVECVQESPMAGAEDILVNDEKCEGHRPASQELCESHKTCKTRQTDQIPAKLLEDVWSQINRRAKKKGDAEVDEILRTMNKKEDICKNASNIKLDVGAVVKDVVPAPEIKVIKIPFKQSHTSLNLSDTAFETMGDSVADKVDTGHAVIAVGGDASKILNKVKDTPEEKAEEATQSKAKGGKT